MIGPTEGVVPRSPQTVTRKLLDAVAAVEVGVEADIQGCEKGSIHITGITTATVDFEGTIDGTNWESVADLDAATSASADGVHAFGERLVGLRGFRLNVSAYTSGTITAWGSFWG